jgi:DNA-binding MarR family transcriptional regulator
VNAPFAPAAGADQIDLGALTGSLGFLLRLAQVRLYAQFFAAFAGTPVKPGEFTVLWVIDLNPGVPQGSLARVLAIKPAHMTKLVQRLVEAGQVARETPATDRRAVHLTLTPAGQAHLDRYRAAFLNVHAAERTGLSERESADLLRLLTKLAFPAEDPCP